MRDLARLREYREGQRGGTPGGLHYRCREHARSLKLTDEAEDLSNVLHRARPMLAPVTSISTKDNVKNLPTIPGKERNARVEQISSDHPRRSNQARAERPEKNAGRYPDDQRGDHDQKPNQNQQRCERSSRSPPASPRRSVAMICPRCVVDHVLGERLPVDQDHLVRYPAHYPCSSPVHSRSLSNFACSFCACLGLVVCSPPISCSHAVNASSAV